MRRPTRPRTLLLTLRIFSAPCHINGRQLTLSTRGHLRLSHTSPYFIHAMAQIPTVRELPAELKISTLPMNCEGCATTHICRAAQFAQLVRLPPDHTVATNIFGLIRQSSQVYDYVMSFTELHIRMTHIYLLCARH